MRRWVLAAAVVVLVVGVAGTALAGTWVFTGGGGAGNCDKYGCPIYDGDDYTFGAVAGSTYTISTGVSASFNNAECSWCNMSCEPWSSGTSAIAHAGNCYARVCSNGGGGSVSSSTIYPATSDVNLAPYIRYVRQGDYCCIGSCSGTIIISNETTYYTVSGSTDCIDETVLYLLDSGSYHYIDSSTGSSYSFRIFDGLSYRLTFDGAYYDFTCTGNEVFDYDACLYVYGYTCGIDSIKLYVDDGGSWVLNDTEAQSTGYEGYEMQIFSGESYLISFLDGGTVCHNQTFTCTGDHVHIDYDRCEWVYPPSPWEDPIIIYLWAGYAYNIVVFRDEHGNFIENSQLAIYDKTDDQYLQKWTDTKDGYALLGARFDTDHDVLLTLRTFDGVFTLDTVYPANGSALVGEEDITTTNWTIPIRYNLRVFPVDQAAVPLFDVFCGLSEYTPLSPQAFWGYSMGGSQYVPITNCSGFAMCDLIAEKGGYRSYNVTALNWTSRSAMVKDYRHAAVLAKE